MASGGNQAILCDDMGISSKTFKRWKLEKVDKREGPLTRLANKLTNTEKEEIIKISTSKEFMDLPPCQIVPRLADQGKYVASESSFYRVLREFKLLHHRGKAKKKSSHRESSLIATGPNQIYSWDITYLRGPIKGQFYYLYMFMDIFSRKIVGYEVHENECNIKASNLIEDICEKEGVKGKNIVLHSDNGGPMKGLTMLAMLYSLGITPSFNRPSVSNDNPFSESLFRTLKYCPTYPKEAFGGQEEARSWVKSFVDWYNNSYFHSGIKFVTPSNRHQNNDVKILLSRKKVYETAKEKNPLRWSKNIRNWDYVTKVYLKKVEKIEFKKVS